MILGYARVSRADQKLDLQVQAILKYGVEAENLYVEKVSGVSKKRLSLELCLSRLNSGDILVVWKLDRLGRSLKDLNIIAEDFNERNITMISLTEQLDTKTAMGKFTFNIMAASAQLERELLSERTKAGLQASKEAGNWRTKPVSFKRVNYESALKHKLENPTASIREVAKASGMKSSIVGKHWDKVQSQMPWPWGDNVKLKGPRKKRRLKKP